MSKHTKGPWKVHSNGIAVFTQDDSRCLAIAPTEADAQLIAAAPDMVELLDELSDVFSDLTDEDTLLSKQMYKKIRDVIAKAEGKK